jgi:ATP-dependent DNA helicase HFM1/MER3
MFSTQHEPYHLRNVTQDGYQDCVEQDAIPLQSQRSEIEMNYFQNDSEFCKPPLATLLDHRPYFGHEFTDHTPAESLPVGSREYIYPLHSRHPHGEDITCEEKEAHTQTGELPNGQKLHRSRLRPVSELRWVLFST